MSLSKKKLVENFYTSDFYKPGELENYIHPEAKLYWNSSEGFNLMIYEDIKNLSEEMSKSYLSIRASVSHVLRDKDNVTIRFTYHVRTIENPDEEITLGHFIAIWTIEDGKMKDGYQISQPGDETPENLSSFLTTNF